MSGQTIDYEALAKQAGAISSQPVDYEALAKQAGATSSQTPPESWLHKVLAPREVPKRTIPLEQTSLPGSTEGPGMTEGLAEYEKASAGEVGGGVRDISQGNVAKGTHRIVSGVGAGVAPVAAMTLPAVAAAAPITTALGIGGGIGGQKLAHAGAEALGATPDQADLAGDVGGVAGGYLGSKVPAIGQKALLLGKTPAEAYQSALKPSTTIPPAKVDRMVQTGLENEIPVSKGGAEKLQSLLEDLQDKVTQEIGSGQGKTISKGAVLQRLNPVAARFAQQVTPAADLNAIADTGTEFAASHPADIPAADAQAMKVGTYQQLKGKAYGELKSATIESQKALARGLKEELANAFPELSNLNAQESKIYDLQPILEKAIQRQANHQIMGIGTPIVTGATKAVTGSTGLSAVAGAIKAVVDNPIVKSKLAISLNKAGVPWATANARIAAYSGALAGAVSGANEPDSGDQKSQPPQ